MKNKNDVKSKLLAEQGIMQPQACSNCQHKDLNPVAMGSHGGISIVDLATYEQKSSWKRLWTTRFNPVYGWHCPNCGHIMLFTTRTLK